MTKVLAFMVIYFYSISSFAIWQCPAIDSSGHLYAINSSFIKMAVYKSLDLCKKRSNSPASCIVERAYCHRIASSNSPKSHWQCFSFDRYNDKFPSGPYSDRYHAAQSAKRICAYLSKAPTTCYVPLFTCEKI